ncbi:Bifunctional homocysteine S-methyltransferase/5,10-methylenetetrahydrofolate reductase [Paenibacillus sp. P1XP2]|nr:Bifunctional homocysteine S-methyltransferase/5,10-methylenetetrahydrofolate reductase [Paenibacillus sp. P1XP2]
MKPDLRVALDDKVLVGDGAMGTFLYQMGFPVGISYEELNLTSPEVIRDVHRRYVQAGAQVLESNTFSANYDKLSKYGLESKVSEINRAGVRIAREAAPGRLRRRGGRIHPRRQADEYFKRRTQKVFRAAAAGAPRRRRGRRHARNVLRRGGIGACLIHHAPFNRRSRHLPVCGRGRRQNLGRLHDARRFPDRAVGRRRHHRL